MKQLLKHSINGFLRKVGLEIRPWVPFSKQPTLGGCFQRLQEHGIVFNTVIDVGASNGCWSIDLQQYFPDKSHLLIEANPIRKETLSLLCKSNPKWTYTLKAAGEKEGNLFFDATDPQGGHLSEKPRSEKYKPFPVTTIDSEVRRLGLQPPFLIKLDTHGVEVPILCGATKTLDECEVVIIECYNFPTESPCLSFWEMCAWMSDKGFSPIGVHDIIYREYDHAFWQLDIVFVRKTRPEFAYRNYK
jgi:FkbM family methyltransferase